MLWFCTVSNLAMITTCYGQFCTVSNLAMITTCYGQMYTDVELIVRLYTWL